MLDVDDHRWLGQRLDLFHLQEEAPGMVFRHPRGFALFRLLEDAVRRRVARDGYREVRTRQVLRQSSRRSSRGRARSTGPSWSCRSRIGWGAPGSAAPSSSTSCCRSASGWRTWAPRARTSRRRCCTGPCWAAWSASWVCCSSTTGGALPPWLAPDQVVVAPVAEAHRAYANRVLSRLVAIGIRARLDAGSETLSRRLVEAHEQGIPLFVVVGAREAERASITVRERDGEKREHPLDEGVQDLARRCAPPDI